MLDAWVAEVGAQGCDRTNVYTDSTISRDFYERYGFKRVREAHIKSLFYSLPGIDVQGCI